MDERKRPTCSSSSDESDSWTWTMLGEERNVQSGKEGRKDGNLRKDVGSSRLKEKEEFELDDAEAEMLAMQLDELAEQTDPNWQRSLGEKFAEALYSSDSNGKVGGKQGNGQGEFQSTQTLVEKMMETCESNYYDKGEAEILPNSLKHFHAEEELTEEHLEESLFEEVKTAESKEVVAFAEEEKEDHDFEQFEARELAASVRHADGISSVSYRWWLWQLKWLPTFTRIFTSSSDFFLLALFGLTFRQPWLFGAYGFYKGLSSLGYLTVPVPIRLSCSLFRWHCRFLWFAIKFGYAIPLRAALFRAARDVEFKLRLRSWLDWAKEHSLKWRASGNSGRMVTEGREEEQSDDGSWALDYAVID